jgi:enoyl-[acyl-carrier-protein] reductase (NADH)
MNWNITLQQDASDSALSLLGHLAATVTGQIIFIDGGVTIH